MTFINTNSNKNSNVLQSWKCTFPQRVLGCFTGCERIPLPMTARLIFCHAGHRVSFALTSQNTESSWQAENKIGILAAHRKTIQ